MRIIIVDDDYYTCETLSRILEAKGFSTLVHYTIADAVPTLLAEDFDLMLLDSHLPGLEGTDALPIIHEVSPRLPVILMMNKTTRENREKASRAGAFCILQNPVSHRELLRAIRSTSSASRAKVSHK
jgi:DNA-binding response OmpR family regulator